MEDPEALLICHKENPSLNQHDLAALPGLLVHVNLNMSKNYWE